MQTKQLATLTWTALVLIRILVGPAVLNAAESQPVKRPIAVEDLYLFEGPQSPMLSPDGKRAAYVRSWIDRATKLQRYSLWLVEEDRENSRALEAGQPDARSPFFSSDGKWIFFRSTRPRPKGWRQTPPVPPESEAATDLWLIPAAGGKAIPLAGPNKPYGRLLGDRFYQRIAFSPDGSRLVFVADDGKDPRTPEEIAAGVIVVRPDQGEGYTGYGPAQIWVAHLDSKPSDFAAIRIDRLTDDDVWYGDPQWSPDGKTIVVHANRTDDRESVRYSINKNYDLWAIDVRTHKIRRLTSGSGPEVSPRFSPDGKQLVCLSVPRKGPHFDVFNLLRVELGGAKPQAAVLFDHHGAGADDPPHPAPSYPLPVDCWLDDRHVMYSTAVGTTSKTVRVDLQTAKAAQPGTPDSESAARRQRRGQLTPSGNQFLRERLIAESRVVKWNSPDGMEIEGVLTVPHPSVAKPPYKLVLYPHGGPHSRSGRGFNFTAQVFAGQGYAVFQPNFRGSYGYGREFLDADRKDLGGGDMRDILSGIDWLVKQKLVDPKQQFVYGVSYGGFMTCWLVGQTTQFRAAVAQNAVTDMNVMWGLSDLQSWTEWELGGLPWEVPDAMRHHSPLAHVAKVRTPTLILHSREDRRCPIAMGYMFHQALLARGVPTGMVVYPHEGHGIRQPRHREDVLRRTLAWFEKHGRGD